MIQSIGRENNAGARTHPWRTPEEVLNAFDSLTNGTKRLQNFQGITLNKSKRRCSIQKSGDFTLTHYAWTNVLQTTLTPIQLRLQHNRDDWGAQWSSFFPCDRPFSAHTLRSYSLCYSHRVWRRHICQFFYNLRYLPPKYLYAVAGVLVRFACTRIHMTKFYKNPQGS